MARIRGTDSSPLHKKVFGGDVDGRLFLKWLAQRITKIELEKNLEAVAQAGKKGIRFSIPFRSKPGANASIIRLGYYYAIGNLAQRLGTLIHEARHNDGFVHQRKAQISKEYFDQMPKPIKCTFDFYYQCDNTGVGAYGTEIIFSANVGKFCTSCTKALAIEFKKASWSDFSFIVDAVQRVILQNDLYDQGDLLELQMLSPRPI